MHLNIESLISTCSNLIGHSFIVRSFLYFIVSLATARVYTGTCRASEMDTVTDGNSAAINIVEEEEGAQKHPDTQEIINECIRNLITF